MKRLAAALSGLLMMAGASATSPCMGECSGIDALATILICPNLGMSQAGLDQLTAESPSLDLLTVEVHELQHVKGLCQPKCVKNKDPYCMFIARY